MWDLDGALKALNKNEQAIFAVCHRIKSVPDEAFLLWYPSAYGAQVSYSDGCLRLVAAPALPRENNNCWSLIEQMILWQRWFRLRGPTDVQNYPAKQRFLVEITHHSKAELPFIPNTLEAHSYVNGLTKILHTDDDLSIYDYSVGVEPVENGPEYCEITVSRLPVLEVKPGFLNMPLPCSAEAEIVSDDAISKLLPKLDDLMFEQLFGLYHALLAKDWAVRQRVSYESIKFYNPLRRRNRSRVKPYSELIKSKGFSIVDDRQTGTLSIVTDAPFRTREEYSADAFLEFLCRFLRTQESVIRLLQEQNQRLEIHQKTAKPDGDNIPFERISQLLMQEFLIPIVSPLKILYKPEAEAKTSIVLTRSPTGNPAENVRFFKNRNSV